MRHFYLSFARARTRALRLAQLTLFCLILFVPERAFACSRLLSGELIGYPSDGAEDVPLDVIPVYVVPGRNPFVTPWFSLTPTPKFVSEVTLVSELGAVPVTVRGAEGMHVELVPATSLAPNTRYTLSLTWSEGGTNRLRDALSFTTGNAPFSGALSPPPVTIAEYTANHSSTCDPGPESACLSLPDDEMVMVEVVGNEHPALELGSFFVYRPDPDEYTFECLRIRRRAPNGVLGEPTVICTEDGPRFDLTFDPEKDEYLAISCDQEGLKQNRILLRQGAHERPEPAAVSRAMEPEGEGGVDERSATASTGCGVASARQTPGVALVLLALAAALGRSARVRARAKPRRLGRVSLSCSRANRS